VTAARTVAAVDFGAESGRVATVSFDGNRPRLELAYRFQHAPRVRDGILRWDLAALRAGVRDGLARLDAGERAVSSVGVDTWGVDYALRRADGGLVDEPTCYRDQRQVAAMATALREVGAAELYQATGVQLIPINTLFGLVSDVREHPHRLAAASGLLMMPDLFHHLLTGCPPDRATSEYTIASTTGAMDMRTGRWASELVQQLGIPTRLLPEVVPPGTELGPLRSALDERSEEYSGALRGCRVIMPAAHDTASAVVAAPLRHAASIFISSGTWSLVGMETDRPWTTDEARLANLTNEGGYAGTIRLLRNVMGLWLLQECRRQWARDGLQLGYPEIAELAAVEPGLVSLVNPDHTDFLGPGDMPRRIQAYCARTGQPVPEGVGAVARCVVDSLALGYRRVIEAVAAITGANPPTVHIVGGGASHTLLCQLTADATGLPVYAGPTEATALGNAAVQLVTLGELAGLADIRAVVAASTEPTEYRPRPGRDWAAASAQLAELIRADQLGADRLRADRSGADQDRPDPDRADHDRASRSKTA
jgi:rhamnulokinase